MSDESMLVPLRKAVTELGLEGHFENRVTLDELLSADDDLARKSGGTQSLKVRRYSNHAVVSGDLDMDALLNDENIAGIAVDGDLELHGSIFNWEIDTLAAFLWVRGNLHCQNIVFGGMDMVVNRNVTAAGLIVATYNHGHLLIVGDVHADRVIIDDDGPSVIGGRVHAKGWNASYNAEVEMRRSEWIDEIKPEFRDEFFDKRGEVKCASGNVDLVKALLAGRDILRAE